MEYYIGLEALFIDVAEELQLRYIQPPVPSDEFEQIRLTISDKRYLFRIDVELWYSSELEIGLTERIKTLLYNNIWLDSKEVLTKEKLEKFVLESLGKESPEGRIEKLLEFIYSKRPFAGQSIDISMSNSNLKEQYWRKMFFHTLGEFDYYIRNSRKLGYIEFDAEDIEHYWNVRLTPLGLKTIMELEDTKRSNFCFVAMSFDDAMYEVYNSAIRPAILQTGFEPILMSEEKRIGSDVTINDAILSSIKKSKFTIADFTNHKHGVYFEAGYALGKGQKVIYTCKSDAIDNAHFDTRNYAHLIWKDAEDLKKQLVDKIDVFIKE